MMPCLLAAKWAKYENYDGLRDILAIINVTTKRLAIKTR